MLVDVSYPAPLLYVPKGGRNERVGYAEMRAPVRLREAERGDLVEAGRFRPNPGAAEETLYAFDGALWRAAPSEGGTEASATALTEFLRGEGFRRHFRIRDHFARTPLAFTGLAGDPEEAADPDKVRSIRFDGREDAEARLASFVASDLLVAGQEAFMRSRPVLSAGYSRRDPPLYQALEIAPGHWRTMYLRTERDPYASNPYQLFVGCPDDPEGFHEYIVASSVGQYLGGYKDRTAPEYGLPKGLHGDGDMLLMANVIPETILGNVRYALAHLQGRAAPDDPTVAALERARDDLIPLVVLGNVGGIGPEDARRTIDRSLECARVVGGIGPAVNMRHLLGAFETWHGMVAMKRYAEMAAATPAADVDAISGLAP